MRVGRRFATLASASSPQPVLAVKLDEVTCLPLCEAAKGIVSEDAR